MLNLQPPPLPPPFTHGYGYGFPHHFHGWTALASGLLSHGLGCALHRPGLCLVRCAPAGTRATFGQAARPLSPVGSRVMGEIRWWWIRWDSGGDDDGGEVVKFFLFGPQEQETASIIAVASQPPTP